MNRPYRSPNLKSAAVLGLASLLFFAASGRPAGVHAQSEDPSGAPRTPETAIEDWPEAQRDTAGAMIDKYGEPIRFTKYVLVWLDQGPWRRIAVHRDSSSRFFTRRNDNFLEETVDYQVPADKAEELKRFDSRIEVSVIEGRLTACTESEAMNILTLNLADEIVTGKRSVKDARDFYAKTERLAKAGKSSPYLEGLMFKNRPAELPETDYDEDFMP